MNIIIPNKEEEVIIITIKGKGKNPLLDSNSKIFLTITAITITIIIIINLIIISMEITTAIYTKIISRKSNRYMMNICRKRTNSLEIIIMIMEITMVVYNNNSSKNPIIIIEIVTEITVIMATEATQIPMLITKIIIIINMGEIQAQTITAAEYTEINQTFNYPV